MIKMYEMYQTNNKFKAFVDGFTRKHRTTVENSLKCMQVKDEFIRLIKAI